MATLEDLLTLVNTVLENSNKKTAEKIEPTTSLRNDLGMDSLDLAELTVRIEDTYGVDVFKKGIVDNAGEILARMA